MAVSGSSRLSNRLVSAIAMAIAAVSATPALAQSGPSGEGADAGGFNEGEIIVTARRREEKLQDVPQAILAFSGEQLERANVTEVPDLVRISPGLVYQPTALGKHSMSLTLRSQRQNLPNIVFDPSVVIYFNEIPNMRMIGANAALYDLSSVQVLKGPQGTLFGRNSTGGAVLITPQAPTEDVEGYVKAGIGNYGSWEAEAAVNLPIGDRIRLRLAGRHSQRNGYMPVVGQDYSVDDDNVDAFRVSLRLEPVDGLVNTTVFDTMSQRASGTAFQLVNCLPGGISNRFFGHCAEEALLEGEKWNATTSNVDRKGTDNKAWQLSNITTAEIGDITLKNIFGYRDLDAFITFDLDGSTKDILFATDKIDIYQISNEIQLIGTAMNDTLTYQIGGFFFEENGDELQLTPTLGTTSVSDFSVINRSYSVFGQATWKIPGLEKLSLTAGLRQTWDKREMTNRGQNLLGTYTGRDLSGIGSIPLTCRLQVSALASDGVLNPCEKTVQASFSKLTYNFSADYKVTDDVLVYAATRKGYRAGGFFNAPRAPIEFKPYNPELLTDYEIGLKASYRMGSMRGRTNIALYTGDFKGAQRNTTTQEVVTDPTTGQQITINRSIISNVESARVRGIEIEQMLKPFELLELNVSYAYSDAKYKKFLITNLDGSVFDYTDSPFAGAPAHTLSGSVRLELPVSDTAGRVFAQVSGSYVSKTVTADGDPSYNGGTTTDPRDGTPPFTVRPNAVLPSYHTLDARLDWQGVMNTGLDLSVWVRNFTNEQYSSGGQFVAGLGYGVNIPGTPRTFGVQARYAF